MARFNARFKAGIAAAIIASATPLSAMAQSTPYWGTGSSTSQPITKADCPEAVAAIMNQQTRKAVDQYGSLAQQLYDELQQAKYDEMSCIKRLMNQHPTLSGLGIPSLTDLLQQFGSAVCNALETKVSSLESQVESATQTQSNGYELIPGVPLGQSSSNISFTEGSSSEQNDASYGVNLANQSMSFLSNGAKYPITSMVNSFSNNVQP